MDRHTGSTDDAAHAAELLELGDAFFELDRDWRIVRVNRRQEELSRRPGSQTVGRTFAEVWPDLATPSSRFWREYDRCMRERAPVQFQAYYEPLDLWTGVTAYPVSSGGIAVFFRDITPMKRAEREQARLASIVENTDDAIISKDLEGVILTWNRGAERLFGYAADEALGRPIRMLLPPDRADEEDRILARIREGHRVDHFETQRIAKGGTRLDVSVTVSPLRDERGHLVGASKIARDITERRRTGARLGAALLRAEEERRRLAAVLESLPAGVVITDAEGGFTHVNAEFKRIWGAPPEPRSMAEYGAWHGWWPDGRPVQTAEWALSRALSTGEVILPGDVVEIEKFDGSGRATILNAAAPIRNAEGAVVGGVLAEVDVTEQKRAEEALRRAEVEYRTLAENAPEVIARFDRQLRHTFINEYGAKVYGVAAPDVLGKTNAELGMPPDQVESWRRHFEEVFATGAQRTVEFEFGGPTFGRQYFSSLFVPERDESGAVVSILAITRDVTERRRVESALRESEAKFRSVFEQAAVGMGRVRFSDARWIDVNDVFCRMLGRTRDEMLSTPWPAITHPDDVELDLVPFRRMAAGDLESYSVEKRFLHADGSHVWAKLTLSVVRDASGRPEYEIAIVEDIGERKRAEEALRQANERLRDADRRKDEFLGMLSHELRNPLAPIRNSLFILDRAEPHGPQACRAREVVNRQIAHLTRLVDDLLDVTRIARGKIELRRARLDVAALARRAAEDYRALMHERGVDLVVDVPGEAVAVDGDETRLAQVLGNLLSNAAKFTPAGGRVSLTVRESGGRAVARVQDTGVGIAPDLLPTIFDPFIQAEQTLARSEGGLGLGLALVKGLTELHGGRVSATSGGLGRGTEFTVELPLERSAPARASPGVTGARRRHRVLVVDDNADAAESLAELVRLFGHDAEVAYDGPGALATATASHPDVVLCDLGLPGMDGYEVAKALRAKLDGGVQLVAVSGYARPEDVKRSSEAGFDSHVAKPPDPARIERLLA